MPFSVGNSSIPVELDLTEIIQKFETWANEAGGEIWVADKLSEAYLLGRKVEATGGVAICLENQEGLAVMIGATGVEAEDARAMWDCLCGLSN